MCQHVPNLIYLDLGFGRSGFSIKMQSSILMQAYNAVGCNTRGAASNTADSEAQEIYKIVAQTRKNIRQHKRVGGR